MGVLRRIECTSCGAPIEIAPSSVAVRCDHCGSHQAVNPEISTAHHVEQIDRSVGNVDRATARLAAEIALPRLHAERVQADQLCASLELKQRQRKTNEQLGVFGPVVLVSIFLPLGVGFVAEQLGVARDVVSGIVLVGFLVMGVLGSYVGRNVLRNVSREGSEQSAELDAARERLRAIDRRIAENYELANS